MSRRNRPWRHYKGSPDTFGAQKGKGGKRRKEWHHRAGSNQSVNVAETLPDVGTGADPTEGTGRPLRHP